MIYVDTSSLLKLVLPDACSVQVDLALSLEEEVVVSLLTELEAGVQIKAHYLGGKISEARAFRVRSVLAHTLAQDPFIRKKLSGAVFQTALVQHEMATAHCRSLDRLHLAAMEELGLKRLMTHDMRQAGAARELGFEVVSPGL